MTFERGGERQIKIIRNKCKKDNGKVEGKEANVENENKENAKKKEGWGAWRTWEKETGDREEMKIKQR